MTGSPETPVLATHNGFHAHVDFGVSSCLFHSRVRKFFDGAMRRPVQSVARGRTAIQSLICLGHVPSQYCVSAFGTDPPQSPDGSEPSRTALAGLRQNCVSSQTVAPTGGTCKVYG